MSARWTGHADVQAELPEPAVIALRPERTDAVLGLEVSAAEQAAILAKLGFEQVNGGFRVPTWRARDVTREIDLVEEVARFKMEEIPFTLPERDAMFGRLTRWQRLRRLVEDVLTGCGFSEAYTSTFVADGERAAAGAALAGGRRASHLARSAASSPPRATTSLSGRPRSRSSRSRGRTGQAASCRTSAGMSRASSTAASPRAKWAVEQLYDALKIEPAYERAAEPLLHPGKSARTAEGFVGELHPTLLEGLWGVFELDLDALVAAAPAAVEFNEVSPYPEVRQDLAFVIDEAVPAAERARSAPRGGEPAPALRRDLRRVPGRADRRRQAVARVPRRLRLARAHAHRRRGRRGPRPDRRRPSPTVSAPSCGPDQTGPTALPYRGRGGQTPRRLRRSSRSSAQPGSARADNPMLIGDVGLGDSFSISLKDASGAPVKHLAIGTYTLLVHDHSAIHNFDLFGPDVTAQTGIDTVGDQTFTITITDGTYTYVCDAHPTQMKGSFTAGNVTTPPPPLPVKPVVTSAHGVDRRRRQDRPSSPRAASHAGKFKLTVSDRTANDGFRLAGPGVAKSTGVEFKGTATWTGTLKPGKYSYGSVRSAKLRRSFTVSG